MSNSKFIGIYYQNIRGECPVEEFLDSLDRNSLLKFFFELGLLEEFGYRLPLPHGKKVDKQEDIYELRFKGREGNVRVLYFFFDGNKAIFTNGFVKKKQKTPPTELKTAKQRKYAYLENKMGKTIEKPKKYQLKKKRNKLNLIEGRKENENREKSFKR
jgi:phage-related protein